LEKYMIMFNACRLIALARKKGIEIYIYLLPCIATQEPIPEIGIYGTPKDNSISK